MVACNTGVVHPFLYATSNEVENSMSIVTTSMETNYDLLDSYVTLRIPVIGAIGYICGFVSQVVVTIGHLMHGIICPSTTSNYPTFISLEPLYSLSSRAH